MKLLLGSLLYDLVFSERCPCCGKSSHWRNSPFCNLCWNEIKPLTNNKITTGFFDGDFWKYIDSLHTYGSYEGILKKSIHLFKYSKIKRLGKSLGKILSEIDPPDIDVLIPVPLDNNKLRQREFNQTAILAYHLSKEWNLPIELDLLIKIKKTKDQASLDKKERIINLKDAFRIVKPLKYKRIGLVDDVVTTGTTLIECSKTLRKAGAEKVHAITLAKTF